MPSERPRFRRHQHQSCSFFAGKHAESALFRICRAIAVFSRHFLAGRAVKPSGNIPAAIFRPIPLKAVSIDNGFEFLRTHMQIIAAVDNAVHRFAAEIDFCGKPASGRVRTAVFRMEMQHFAVVHGCASKHFAFCRFALHTEGIRSAGQFFRPVSQIPVIPFGREDIAGMPRQADHFPIDNQRIRLIDGNQRHLGRKRPPRPCRTPNSRR